MLTFLPLLGLFSNIILQAVGAAGVLSPATVKLITDLIGGVTPLIGNLATGQTKLQDVLAVLAGLQSVIAALKADTSLPTDRLALLTTLEGEVTAAINAYILAGKGFDPTNYAPVQPVA